MRRIILALAACVTTNFVLAASAQAATSAPARVKAFHLNVYEEGSEGLVVVNEATVDITGKLHAGTWAIPEEQCGGSPDPYAGGSYVKENHTFTFTQPQNA